MAHELAKVHRMFELVEPIATLTFSSVTNEAFLALGMRDYWDGYFAGRAAPLGLAPAGVVHAVFYNFADGEVARHIPWVWRKVSPGEAIAVRERSSAAALRQKVGKQADSPALVRIADLAARAAVSAPTEGRALYAGLWALDMPAEPVARLWHAATLLREHRGDGHNSVLVGGATPEAERDEQRDRCERVGEVVDGVAARRAIDPVAKTITTWMAAVTASTAKDTLTAWMPRWSLSYASSIGSAASWLCGRKISASAQRSPGRWTWPWSPPPC